MAADEPDRQLLSEEEGKKLQPYYDNQGFASFGVGRLCDPRKPCPFPVVIVDQLFEIDLRARRELAPRVPGWERMNAIQRAVIVSMVYQLGLEPFDGDGVRDWPKFVAALRAADFKQAALEGRDSKWWREQTRPRAERQMLMLESGLWVPWEATRR